MERLLVGGCHVFTSCDEQAANPLYTRRAQVGFGECARREPMCGGRVKEERGADWLVSLSRDGHVIYVICPYV